jgi:hypothetical protein
MEVKIPVQIGISARNSSVWRGFKRVGDCAGFCRLDTTNTVAHFHERLDEKHGYQSGIFDHDYLYRFRWFASPSRPRSPRLDQLVKFQCCIRGRL